MICIVPGSVCVEERYGGGGGGGGVEPTHLICTMECCVQLRGMCVCVVGRGEHRPAWL